MADDDWADTHRCHHCGLPPEPDGDHTCPCPYSDDECPFHTRFPPASFPDCTCNAGNDLPFPAQHATLCPRFSCGRTDTRFPPEGNHSDG